MKKDTLYKNSFFAYKNSFFKRLNLVFSRLPEWLKYLKYLKYLNSSACEEICLVFGFLFGWNGENFLLKKNQKGNEKSEKENC